MTSLIAPANPQRLGGIVVAQLDVDQSKRKQHCQAPTTCGSALARESSRCVVSAFVGPFARKRAPTEKTPTKPLTLNLTRTPPPQQGHGSTASITSLLQSIDAHNFLRINRSIARLPPALFHRKHSRRSSLREHEQFHGARHVFAA